MSADNFLSVRRKGDKWVVKDGNASTGIEWERPKDVFDTRDQAIDRAMQIQGEEIVEYGLFAIDPLEALSSQGGSDE